MTNHLTEDQISKWFAGQTTPQGQDHVRGCAICADEVDRFAALMRSFQSAVTTRAERLAHRRSPNLAMVLDAGEAAVPALFGPLESRSEFRRYRWLSVAVHAAVLALLLLPSAIRTPLPTTETLVALYKSSVPLVFKLPQAEQSGGGGGGGRRTPTPPSLGVPPRAADQQLAPPLVEARNLAPELIVESTVVAPQLDMLRSLNVPIGDPNGVIGPPSAGPGSGGGIGTGEGTGVGPGKGPGVGPGENGGWGGGIFGIGGSVLAPIVLYQVQPEYSDDARKARIQGTVELVTIVKADGTVEIEQVRSSLGYGLDQKAIEAVRRWRFRPGTSNGKPVATRVSVFVNFSLR
jgi:TonB family protein